MAIFVLNGSGTQLKKIDRFWSPDVSGMVENLGVILMLLDRLMHDYRVRAPMTDPDVERAFETGLRALIEAGNRLKAGHSESNSEPVSAAI